MGLGRTSPSRNFLVDASFKKKEFFENTSFVCSRLFQKKSIKAFLQRWSDSGFLLSDPILFLKNDIRIRSESCFG